MSYIYIFGILLYLWNFEIKGIYRSRCWHLMQCMSFEDEVIHENYQNMNFSSLFMRQVYSYSLQILFLHLLICDYPILKVSKQHRFHLAALTHIAIELYYIYRLNIIMRLSQSYLLHVNLFLHTNNQGLFIFVWLISSMHKKSLF